MFCPFGGWTFHCVRSKQIEFVADVDVHDLDIDSGGVSGSEYFDHAAPRRSRGYRAPSDLDVYYLAVAGVESVRWGDADLVQEPLIKRRNKLFFDELDESAYDCRVGTLEYRFNASLAPAAVHTCESCNDLVIVNRGAHRSSAGTTDTPLLILMAPAVPRLRALWSTQSLTTW